MEYAELLKKYNKQKRKTVIYSIISFCIGVFSVLFYIGNFII